MSWPTDRKPRFKVTTVHGAYGSGHGGGAKRTLGTSWVILDRARCHARVAEYRSEALVPTRGGGNLARRRDHWQQAARRHADQLNADH